MAREAVLRDNSVKTSRRFSVAGSVDIAKGTALFLGSDGVASSAYVSSWAFLGFAHADKDGSDTNDTSITADKGAVYDLYAGGVILPGALVKMYSGNYVIPEGYSSYAISSYAVVIGHALEFASASGAQINIEVYP